MATVAKYSLGYIANTLVFATGQVGLMYWGVVGKRGGVGGRGL